VWRDADIADPGGGLGWAHVDLAFGPCDRLPDVYDAFGEAEVAATEPAYLAGSQPTPAGQEHR
jgi:hypothetical protein